MMDRDRWSETQIIGIFEALGLNNHEQKEPMIPSPNTHKTMPSSQPIYLPRLSDSSVPPPTGKPLNAKLENNSK